jgi:hypothetical protein
MAFVRGIIEVRTWPIEIFAQIFKSVYFTELKIDGKRDKTLAELVEIFKITPPRVKVIDFSDNDLYQKTVEELVEIFASLPSMARTLILRNNKLFRKPTAELVQIFQALPRSFIMLDIDGNEIDQKPIEELVTIFKAFPPLATVHVGHHNPFQKTVAELKHLQILTALSSSITSTAATLHLDKNYLENYSFKRLIALFETLSSAVITVNLSKCELHRLSTKNLIQLFQAIPLSVTTVDISNNCLFLNKSIEERDQLLDALKISHPTNWREVIAEDNGEAAFARVILPLLSACKQGKLTLDAVSIILSYLLPFPSDKHPLAATKEKLTSAISANVLAIRHIANGGGFFSHSGKRMLEKLKEKSATQDKIASRTLQHFCLNYC